MVDENHSKDELHADAGLREFKLGLDNSAAFDRSTDLEPTDMCFGIGDDATLLRYLTARKFCIADAIAHYGKASQFRSANRLNRLYDEMDVEAFEETRELYPHWCGRVSKDGQPIYTFDTRVLSSTNLAAFRRSTAQLAIPTNAVGAEAKPTAEIVRAVLCFDHLTRFVLPLCSRMIRESTSAKRPASRIVLLVDLSGMSLQQFWAVKGYVQGFIQILSTNFPEILDKVFITKAPSSFSWIWNLIKGWTDPVTAAKFTFLAPGEVETVLREQIEVRDLPKKYGGTLLHEHGMPPILDDGLEKCLDWIDGSSGILPKGPLKWVRDAEGRMKAIATGTVGGQKREDCFATLHKDLNMDQ